MVILFICLLFDFASNMRERICVGNLKTYSGQTGWSPSSAGTGHSGFPGILLGTCRRKKKNQSRGGGATVGGNSVSPSVGKKNNVVAFPDCTQNFICTKSGDWRDPHSRLVWNQPTLRKATPKPCQQALADNIVSKRFIFAFPLLLIETHSTVSGLTSNFQSGDFVRWSRATIIKQLMATERCTSCPPEMERPRLCFNCLQLLTHSSPVNCHHIVHTTSY